MAIPVIAIVGRPNVGKSTLFNRLIGERKAITSPIPGTTRDRIYHEVEIGERDVILVDTGGMEFDKKKNIEADVQAQAKVAVEEANIIFLVVDATQPLTASDIDCANYIRKSKRHILLIANKIDNQKSKDFMSQLYELGFGDAVGISSIHNIGISDLEEAIAKLIKKLKLPKTPARKKNVINISIVGKPNVGKSSLVNALVGKERLIVSNQPGTTIDSTDTPFRYIDQDFVLVDTAGIRRRGKVGKGIEKYGVLRALQAISRSDITCLVLDYESGIANQDLHVSAYLLEAGRGLIVIVNKADLMTNPAKDQEKFLAFLQHRMNYMPWAPVIFVSALKKKHVFKLFELAKNICEERKKKIPDDEFQVFVKTTVWTHAPARSTKRIIISKGAQTATNPPTFTFKTNEPDLIHFSYRRFLENEIRRKYGFFGTAIRLRFERD